jgi:dTDP-4-dehydrorhamnose 3,5-epimerase
MEVIEQKIKGLYLIKPKMFKDARGSFFESYNQAEFDAKIEKQVFVQDNQSISAKNVLRGLHFQRNDFAQAKLIRVVKGAAIDVAVDIRQNSPSFGKYCMLELTEDNNYQFYIPTGFAHGFLSLKDNTILQYKCSAFYSAKHDAAIRWNDPDINIDWGIQNPILSEKDKNAPFLKEIF